jgi:hypothetical protein
LFTAFLKLLITFFSIKDQDPDLDLCKKIPDQDPGGQKTNGSGSLTMAAIANTTVRLPFSFTIWMGKIDSFQIIIGF